MKASVARGLLVCALCAASPTLAQEESNEDRVDPLLDVSGKTEESLPKMVPGTGITALWERSQVTFRATYYGRARNNVHTDSKASEIHVNVLGLGIDFVSGYAWDTIGFDVSANANLGRGHGNSEVLNYNPQSNRDTEYATIGQAALKLKIGQPDLGMEMRGGYTPIRVGTMGTSGGLHPHGYRGVEVKGFLGDFWLGYGWADQFHNEWTRHFIDMTNSWHQNQDGYSGAKRIDYVHSLGGRYSFGPEKTGFVDVGIGEGKDYRRNAQIAASYPFAVGNGDTLTLTGYWYWGKYQSKLSGIDDPRNEHHVSASARYKTGNWTLAGGYGYTHAPDGWEMQFRMTAWANSDNRNFIQTWAQLDDFVWDGESVVQAEATYDLGDLTSIRGLSIGARFSYGWGINNRDGANRGRTGNAWEVDYNIQYVVPEGRLKGMSFGIYPAHLRFSDFDGKYDRNDIKVIVGYSYTFDSMKRHQDKK